MKLCPCDGWSAAHLFLLVVGFSFHIATGYAAPKQSDEPRARLLRPAGHGHLEPSLSVLEERGEAKSATVAAAGTYAEMRWTTTPATCKVSIGLLVANTILSPALTPVFGKWNVAAGWVLPVVIGGNLVLTGTIQRFMDGEETSSWCSILCVWFCVSTFLSAMWTLVFVVHILPGLAIYAKDLDQFKNPHIAGIREQFDRMSDELSDKRKAYYTSLKFKTKCDRLFDDADEDKNGVLDMRELRAAVLDTTEDPEEFKQDEMFIRAFDQNGDSHVEKDEFYEMMKYFDMINPGGFLRDTDSSSDDESSDGFDGPGGTAGVGPGISTYYDGQDSESSSQVTSSREPSKAEGPSREPSKASRAFSRRKSKAKDGKSMSKSSGSGSRRGSRAPFDPNIEQP